MPSGKAFVIEGLSSLRAQSHRDLECSKNSFQGVGRSCFPIWAREFAGPWPGVLCSQASGLPGYQSRQQKSGLAYSAGKTPSRPFPAPRILMQATCRGKVPPAAGRPRGQLHLRGTVWSCPHRTAPSPRCLPTLRDEGSGGEHEKVRSRWVSRVLPGP